MTLYDVRPVRETIGFVENHPLNKRDSGEIVGLGESSSTVGTSTSLNSTGDYDTAGSWYALSHARTGKTAHVYASHPSGVIVRSHPHILGGKVQHFHHLKGIKVKKEPLDSHVTLGADDVRRLPRMSRQESHSGLKRVFSSMKDAKHHWPSGIGHRTARPLAAQAHPLPPQKAGHVQQIKENANGNRFINPNVSSFSRGVSVAFMGKPVDPPGAAIPAFPSSAIAVVQERLYEALKSCGASWLTSSARSGAELLALDAARRLHLRFKIVLPCDPAKFYRSYIANMPTSSGVEWPKIWSTVLSQVTRRGDVIVTGTGLDDEAWQAAGRRIVSESITLAESKSSNNIDARTFTRCMIAVPGRLDDASLESLFKRHCDGFNLATIFIDTLSPPLANAG